jgi:Ribbon-helix-helix protein, copG family
MAERTLEVSAPSYGRLQEMAAWAGISIDDVLEQAIREQYERKFWDAVNAGYAALRADQAAWAEVEIERKLWDGTLLDGLDLSERWTADREAVPPIKQERAS